jgi:hypothetical protein
MYGCFYGFDARKKSLHGLHWNVVIFRVANPPIDVDPTLHLNHARKNPTDTFLEGC